LRLLAELEASGADERIATALDRALDSQPHGEPEPVNLAAMLVHIAGAFGFHDDPRVRAKLARIEERLAEQTRSATKDDVADWLVQAAMALAALPESLRDPSALDTLARRLASLDPPSVQRYRRYSFPTFDRPDDITLARSALRLGIQGEWLQPWIDYIESSQDEEGRWRIGRLLPLPGAVPWPDEKEGTPSRWITAQVLYILRAFYGE
ncbi:MAG: hypothetical protein ACRELV_10210, partial [Longimicrobiales bacterium]